MSHDYRKEFPDFGDLDVEIPKGFEDTSWHNNMCPSFTKGAVTIYIDFAEKALREFPESPRFCVQVYNAEIDNYDDALGTDDWAEVLAFLEKT